jgi:hypothetical protein
MARKKVLTAKRSPHNSHEWVLELSCGHKMSVTMNGRPSNQRWVRCPECQRDSRSTEAGREYGTHDKQNA